MIKATKRRFRTASGVVPVLMGLAILMVASLGAAAQSTDALIGQIRTAITHGTFSFNSADIGPRLTHAHHVVNIIEGTQGANFDGSKGNPGDGYGAINYASDIIASSSGATATYAENVRLYLQWADEEAVRATKATSYDEAGVAIRRALAYLSAALGRPGEDGLLAGALAIESEEPGTVNIDISQFQFGDGQPLTIKVGTTVTWVNHDTAPHTVTGGPLNSGIMNHHDSYTFTFTEPGTYDYICAFHPNMTHRIIVE